MICRSQGEPQFPLRLGGSGAENEWHVEVASAWEECVNKKELMEKSSKISFRRSRE